MDAQAKTGFAGRRWLINSLRALHLAGVVGLGAGLLGSLDETLWHRFGAMLVASGLAIMVVDSLGHRDYFRQVSTLVVGAKILMASWLVFGASAKLPWFWAILVLSVLAAHAPGRVRHRLWI